MKDLKNEVINLRDKIKEMMFAKDGELGKQAEGRMENAAIPENNRNKSRENETDSSEIKSGSINDRLGADMIDKKFDFNTGLENLIKAIQIKESCEENHIQIKKAVKKINLSRTKAEIISEKKQRLKKVNGIGKVNGTL